MNPVTGWGREEVKIKTLYNYSHNATDFSLLDILCLERFLRSSGRMIPFRLHLAPWRTIMFPAQDTQ